jgi:hypothetical protein
MSHTPIIIIKEAKKEFYYYLGLLSTKFAKLEFNLLSILSKLILDDFVLTFTILERNSLSQNIELLKKLNKYKGFEEKSINELIKSIGNLKTTRNLFIHGIWGEPYIAENDISINCKEARILYQEDERKKSWASARNHTFRLSYIKKQIQIIDDLILAQDYLINKIKSS